MSLIVASRRSPTETLRKRYGDAPLLDVTSHGPRPWVRFSPFYPHGGIPVPLSPGHTGMSVEGIWQGLKVFERTDIDRSKLTTTTMQGLKRSSRSFGAVLGHRAGLDGDYLLSYVEARWTIYLPTYRWVLEHCLQDLVEQLRHIAASQTAVLLDYETNSDPDDLSRPLSHAALIARYVENNWPLD